MLYFLLSIYVTQRNWQQCKYCACNEHAVHNAMIFDTSIWPAELQHAKYCGSTDMRHSFIGRLTVPRQFVPIKIKYSPYSEPCFSLCSRVFSYQESSIDKHPLSTSGSTVIHTNYSNKIRNGLREHFH